MLEGVDSTDAGLDPDLTGFSASEIERLFDRVEDGDTTGGDPEPATRETEPANDNAVDDLDSGDGHDPAPPMAVVQPYGDRWIAWMRATGWRRFGYYAWDQGPACRETGAVASAPTDAGATNSGLGDLRQPLMRSLDLGGYVGVERDRSPDQAVQMLALWPTPTSLAPPKDGYSGTGNSAGLVALRQIALGLFPTPTSACASDGGTFEGGVLPGSLVD